MHDIFTTGRYQSTINQLTTYITNLPLFFFFCFRDFLDVNIEFFVFHGWQCGPESLYIIAFFVSVCGSISCCISIAHLDFIPDYLYL